MMIRKTLLIVGAIVAGLVQAETSPLDMSYIEGPNLRLIYWDPLHYLVPHATRTFTNSLEAQKQRFDWTPTEPVSIILNDFADFGNASATVVPYNWISFDVGPHSHAFETFPASERFYSLMNHELVHAVQGDVADDKDRWWRRWLLGKVAADNRHPESLLYGYLTVPRYTSPRWFREGTATFMETWMAGGLGRAQGGYDEMVFRAMVRDGASFYDPLGLASKGVLVDFQVGVNAYLYGTRFVTYLGFHYSPEHVLRWVRRDPDSKAYFADNFQHVFGVSLESAWRDWIAFEQSFQRGNLAEVRRNPVTAHQALVKQSVGSASRLHYDAKQGAIYGAFRRPGIVEFIGAIDLKSGEMRQLTDIKGGVLYKVSSVAFSEAQGSVFYTADNPSLRDLMQVDVVSGATTMLLKDLRVGELALDKTDQSLYGIRHAQGLVSLVKIPAPYTDWFEVYKFPYETVPYDLDISPDGQLMSASVSEINGDQYLRVWRLADLMAGNITPLSEFKFGQSVPEGFVFSNDGSHLYGSSYYTGVSNIFRYETSSGKMDAVSNAESGYFAPLPLPDGRLVVLDYTAAGFLPVAIDPQPINDVSAIKFLGAELAAKHPSVTRWQVPAPDAVNFTQIASQPRPYLPLSHLGLESAYPVLQGYKDSVGLGYRAVYSDPGQFSRFSVMAAHTPDGNLQGKEKTHIEFSAAYLGWQAELAWNRSDFFDLFGPTKLSRKGLFAQLGYTDYLIYDKPEYMELRYKLSHSSGIDTLPDAQNVSTSFSRLTTVDIGLHHSFLRRSLGAVDDEKGWKWSAVASANQANSDLVPQLTAGLDMGMALPLAHSSLWLRTAVGGSGGERANSLANFYFGGFGNNYVDRKEVKRYREFASMPGFKIDEIGGQTFAKGILELNLPPYVFEAAGTPAFYASWLRSAVFASTLWADPDKPALRKRYTSVGAQADVRFSVLHWSEMTLSIGYAQAFREGKKAGDELMVSLRLM